MNVVALPTTLTVEAAWARYVELVRQTDADAELRVRVEHQMAIARAWAQWRDLFLAMDTKC